MTLTFGDKTFQTWPMQHRWPHDIQEGDFIVYDGELMRVETIQRDCPTLDRQKKFSMFVLLKANGEKLPTRNVVGQWQTIQPKRLRYS